MSPAAWIHFTGFGGQSCAVEWSLKSSLRNYSEKINLDDLKLIEHFLGNIRPDVIVYARSEPIDLLIWLALRTLTFRNH